MENRQESGLPRRAWLSVLVIFLLIPALVILGGRLGGRTYYLVGVGVIFLTCLPFFLVFEQHRPQAREVVTLAVLSALAVAARAAFGAIPVFKPMMAVIMISGMAYGPESGFLVGAVTAFASNFLFGQGPWTPWQMFAYGFGGFLAGAGARLKLLPQRKLPMAVFGFFAVVLVIGPILDTCSVFTMPTQVNLTTAGAIYLAGFPYNVNHGLSTLVTLYLVGEPMLGKLNRIKTKYGAAEEWKDWPPEDHRPAQKG